MANSITISGTHTVTTEAGSLLGNLTVRDTLTGLNSIADNLSVTGSGWTPLYTSSLSDLRYAYMSNNDDTASIMVATGSAGQNILAQLYPGDVVVLPWSASLPTLYSKAFNTTASAVLTYILVES